MPLLGRPLSYDSTRRLWVEADGADAFAYSDGDETERWIEAVVSGAADVRLGSAEIERGIRDFPSRYHLSSTRANLLRPLSESLRGRVLEVGAGCGAITRYLGETGGSVVAVEGSLRRAAICRARCRDLDNVEVVCADATRGLPAGAFDTVVLVGVLEYAALGSASARPFADFLALCARALREDGTLVLAIENRLGLKYLAGAPEDHLGVGFAGLHDAYVDGGPATFGRAELDGLLRDAGFGCRRFLFPFPDYKFPQVVMTAAAFDEPSPAIADLLCAQAAPDQSIPYARTFAEELAWPALLQNGLGPELANSFLVTAARASAGRRGATPLAHAYSSGWRRCFQKELVLEGDPAGRIGVRRALLYPKEDAPGGPYRHRVADEPYVEGTLWGRGIYPIVNRERWTAAEVAEWARPWVDLLAEHAGGEDATVEGGLLDCTPFNVIRTPAGRLVAFDQEWEAESPLPLGYLVFRGLVSTLARIRSTAAPADPTLETTGALVKAVMLTLGLPLDDAALAGFAEREAGFQEWVRGTPGDPRALLAGPLPPARVAPTVDAGTELARLRGQVESLVAGHQASAAEIVTRDEVIRTLQSQLAEQTRWAQQSAAEVARRDAIVEEQRGLLNEQTQWAQASAREIAARDEAITELRSLGEQHAAHARSRDAEIATRDAIIQDLQGALSEQTRWAQSSAREIAARDDVIAELRRLTERQAEDARSRDAEIATRDAIIQDLQGSLSEQTRWAQASAREIAARDADVAARDATIGGLQAALAEQVEATETHAARRTEQAGVILELRARLEESRQALVEATRRDDERVRRLEGRIEELVGLSRRSIWSRLTARSGPQIAALHPGWTQAGRRFNVGEDGSARLEVRGFGFGSAATIVVAGMPLPTCRTSDVVLAASVPDELFRLPAVLAVWVDDGTGRRGLSGILPFRVMSKRTVEAYRPATGPGRRLQETFKRLVWAASGVASRIHVSRFYAQRALRLGPTGAPAGRAAAPRIDALHPEWTEAGHGFNTQENGQTSLAVEGSAFGEHAVVTVAGSPLPTLRASDRLLTAHVPDELFARPGVLPVWVDNQNGDRSLSEIRRFRVMSSRTVAAYRGSAERSPRLRRALHFGVWLTAGMWSRVVTPRLYLRRVLVDRPRALRAARRRQQEVATREMVAEHLEPRVRPRPPDIICFSIIDWDFRYQRPQQILARLAAAGHRVFYLSQRFLGAGDESVRLRPLVPGVTEVFLRSPAVNIYDGAVDGEVESALYAALLDLRAAAGLAETICIVHLPFWTPLVLRLHADFGYRVVFDCLDDFAGFHNIGDRMRELEQALAASADRVVVTSRTLADKHAAHEPLLLPNAADYEHFARAPVARARRSLPAGLRRAIDRGARRLGLAGPVLGYYGAIAHWFDVDLIVKAAAARPRWQFVLIGRTDAAVRRTLEGCRNVRLVDEMPYGELPAHLDRFDVCLIPFVVDDLVQATNPVKFFEYLAAGKPVVAARMPELEPFAGDCFLYEGLDEFLHQVERALAGADDPARVEARRAIARANTWDRRVDGLRGALRDLDPRASVIVVTYGGLALTQACVQGLLDRTAYADWELIVVDNHSDDGTPDYLRSVAREHPFVKIVLNDANLGFAAANNQGIRIARGEFIVLLNNDTMVTHGWLGRLLRHLADRRVGMVGPVTNFAGNEARIETDYHDDLAAMDAFADRYTRAHLGRVFDIPMLAMFCVAMRRSLVDRVGLLDERYEIGMFEDDDFARAVKTLGYRVVCAEDVFIHHVGRAAFGRLDPETFQRIFEANRQRFEEKWGDPWIPHRYRPREEMAEPPSA